MYLHLSPVDICQSYAATGTRFHSVDEPNNGHPEKKIERVYHYIEEARKIIPLR